MKRYLLQDRLLSSMFFSLLVSTISFTIYSSEGEREAEGKESERKMIHAGTVATFVLDELGQETTEPLYPRPTSSHRRPSIQTTPMFTERLLPSPQQLSSSPDTTPEAPKSPEPPTQLSPLPLSTAVASEAAEQNQ